MRSVGGLHYALESASTSDRGWRGTTTFKYVRNTIVTKVKIAATREIAPYIENMYTPRYKVLCKANPISGCDNSGVVLDIIVWVNVCDDSLQKNLSPAST